MTNERPASFELAAAYWLGLAAQGGIMIPHDLRQWAQELLRGDTRSAAQVTYYALSSRVQSTSVNIAACQQYVPGMMLKDGQLIMWTSENAPTATRFFYLVPDVPTALLLIEAFSAYDAFLFEGDAGTAGLQVFCAPSSTFDDWYDFEGNDIARVRSMIADGTYDMSLLSQPSGNALDRHIEGG